MTPKPEPVMRSTWAVTGIADGGKPPLLAVGEAKWNDTMDAARIERLRHIRDLVTLTGRYDTANTQLLCFSGAGFNDKVHAAAAADPAIRLIDLATLYGQASSSGQPDGDAPPR